MIRQSADMPTEVRENMRDGGGSVTIKHYFTKDEITANCRLCSRLVLPPGSGIGAHQHDGEDEVFIIEKGSGLLDDGDTKTRVSAGDAILTGNGESHALHNDGDEDLVLTAIIMCY